MAHHLFCIQRLTDGRSRAGPAQPGRRIRAPRRQLDGGLALPRLGSRRYAALADGNGGGPEKIENCVIVGSGPAGHTAAVYAGRAMLEPLLYEGFMAGGVAAGGQLTTTTDVENYPGFPDGIGGPELMYLMRQQSQRSGARIVTETVSEVDLGTAPWAAQFGGPENWDAIGRDPWHDPHLETRAEAHGQPLEYAVTTEGGATVRTRTLIIATGATAKRLDVPGAERLWQRGISACAVCDGALPVFRGKRLVVVGGGDTAAEEATFLTKYASSVTMLVRRDQMRASKAMQQRVFANDKIEVVWDTVLTEVLGDDLVAGVRVRNVKTDAGSELEAGGLFFAIGHEPNTAFLAGQLETDATGYLVTPGDSTVTSKPGVFACGDVQDKVYRQAVTAAGSGCMAAMEAERYLGEHA